MSAAITQDDAQPPDGATQVYPLKTISDDGNVPEHRLTNAWKGQQIYFTVRDANRLRNQQGAIIQGMFDGNPPYSQNRLRQNGQGWRANFNDMEGKARKDAAKTPYFDLSSTAPMYADIITDKRGPILSATAASGVISEEHDRFNREWDGFLNNQWQMFDCFVGFGRGFLQWDPYDSPFFKRIQWSRVMFPDGTSTDPDEWQLFVITHNFNPTTLNGKIRNAEAARSAGWNSAQVKKAIARATPVQPQNQQDLIAVQNAIRDQDIYTTTRANTVQAGSIFVREFSGKWSWMIVQADSGNSKDQALGEKDWLFCKYEVAETIDQLLAVFIFDVENGSMNGLGGIGRDIFDSVKTANRITCELANNTFLRSTILLQATTANSALKSGLIQVGGGITVIPQQVNVQQSTILGDLEGGMAFSQYMANKLDQNTGVYRPSFEKPRGNPESATAASIRYQQSTVLTNSAVERFYCQQDRMYREQVRRLTASHPDISEPGIKAARKFRKRCLERGVSEAQLNAIISVRAMRSIGSGSPAMRQQLTAELSAIVPQLGQRGQRAWREDFIASRGGQTKVERYMPPEDIADLPSEQDRAALTENDSVKGGSQVIIIENDDHIVHLRRHFEAAFGALEAVQQGGPPDEAAAFIAGIMPHIQEHIALVPFPDLQKHATQQLRELDGAYKDLLSAIESNRPDPEAQKAAMTDEEIKTQKAQNDMAIKQQKQAFTQELKTVQAQHAAELKNFQAQSDAARNDAVAQANAQREDANTVAAIERDNAKTTVELENKRAKTISDVQNAKMKAQAQANKPKPSKK